MIVFLGIDENRIMDTPYLAIQNRMLRNQRCKIKIQFAGVESA
jgi:hypothetical protein